MENLLINMGESRGLSNIVVEDEAYIDIEKGLAILFVVRND
jgi:thiamine pyrophosphokinase